MRRPPARPLLPVALAAVAGLAVGGCLPSPVTTQGRSIADLYTVFFAGGVIVAAIVWISVTLAILLRRRDDGMPRQVEGNLRIEAIWTVVPLLTVFGLFALTILTLNTVNARGPGGVSVNVIAFRWSWQFDYTGNGVSVVGQLGQQPELVVPVGEPVHVSLSAPANDVNHAFFVPQFLFKRDAIAGRTTDFDFTVDQPGVYRGQCAEFCGVYHDAMLFSVRAVGRPEFDAWLAQQRSGASGQPSVAASGQPSAAASPQPASAQPSASQP